MQDYSDSWKRRKELQFLAESNAAEKTETDLADSRNQFVPPAMRKQYSSIISYLRTENEEMRAKLFEFEKENGLLLKELTGATDELQNSFRQYLMLSTFYVWKKRLAERRLSARLDHIARNLGRKSTLRQFFSQWRDFACPRTRGRRVQALQMTIRNMHMQKSNQSMYFFFNAWRIQTDLEKKKRLLADKFGDLSRSRDVRDMFTAWREHTAEQNATRRKFASIMVSSYSNMWLKTAFVAWRDHNRGFRAQQDKISKLRLHFGARNLRNCFDEWRMIAVTQNLSRNQLLSTMANTFECTALRRIFTAWRRWASRNKGLQRGAETLRFKLGNGTKRIVFTNWRDWAHRQRYIKDSVVTLRARMQGVQVRDCFKAWAGESKRSHDLRRRGEMISARLGVRNVRQVFDEWREWTRKRRALTDRMELLQSRYEERTLADTFHQWKLWVRLQKSSQLRDNLIEHLTCNSKKKVMAEVLDMWKEFVKRSKVARALLGQTKTRSLNGAFLAWKRFVRNEKAARHNADRLTWNTLRRAFNAWRLDTWSEKQTKSKHVAALELRAAFATRNLESCFKEWRAWSVREKTKRIMLGSVRLQFESASLDHYFRRWQLFARSEKKKKRRMTLANVAFLKPIFARWREYASDKRTLRDQIDEVRAKVFSVTQMKAVIREKKFRREFGANDAVLRNEFLDDCFYVMTRAVAVMERTTASEIIQLRDLLPLCQALEANMAPQFVPRFKKSLSSAIQSASPNRGGAPSANFDPDQEGEEEVVDIDQMEEEGGLTLRPDQEDQYLGHHDHDQGNMDNDMEIPMRSDSEFLRGSVGSIDQLIALPSENVFLERGEGELLSDRRVGDGGDREIQNSPSNNAARKLPVFSTMAASTKPVFFSPKNSSSGQQPQASPKHRQLPQQSPLQKSQKEFSGPEIKSLSKAVAFAAAQRKLAKRAAGATATQSGSGAQPAVSTPPRAVVSKPARTSPRSSSTPATARSTPSASRELNFTATEAANAMESYTVPQQTEEKQQPAIRQGPSSLFSPLIPSTPYSLLNSRMSSRQPAPPVPVLNFESLSAPAPPTRAFAPSPRSPREVDEATGASASSTPQNQDQEDPSSLLQLAQNEAMRLEDVLAELNATGNVPRAE